MLDKIDFVVTWVDGNDPVWLASKAKYAKEANVVLNSDARYRDWEIFKYWFRTVEKYAPWVNKIFLITEGHLPEWINLEHPKLVHIKHSDYIDEQYFPTFNSNVIELNIPNIKELSENFILFNDDMILNSPVEPSDFFSNGVPRDCGIFSPIVPNGGIVSMVLNNVEIINKYFTFSQVLKNGVTKYFNIKYGKHLIKNICVSPWMNNILGFYDNHIPISYKKSNFEKIWQLEEARIRETSYNKFRTRDDITHWLVRYWQICKGDFVPREADFGRHYNLLDEIDVAIQAIEQGKYKVVCLNDGDSVANFEQCKTRILNALEKKYPHKSIFEK